MRLSQFTQKVEKSSIDDRIMPLINIVFLLLIFFLVAGVIREADPMDITPPESVTESVTPENSINLYMDESGQLAMGQNIIRRSDIIVDLQRLLNTTPNSSVRIVADREVDTVEIVDLMDNLRKAGVTKVSLVTNAVGSAP